MSDIPEELYLEILKKLPVKGLLKFRTVCRLWKRLISDPIFPEAQFESAVNNQRINSSLLLSVSTTVPQLESLELDGPLRNHVDALSLASPLNLGKPHLHPQVLLLGSSNGLVCASLACSDGPVLTSVSFEALFMWNPLTGNSQMLESPEFSAQHVHLISHGFGYISATKDYKLVLSVVYLDDVREISGEVQLISVINGKKSMKGPCRSVVDSQGVVVKQKVHWIDNSFHNNESSIVAFDLVKEEFQRMPLPWSEEDYRLLFQVALYCNEENLCLWHYGRLAATGPVEYWVMSTYGANDSWSMRYTFKLSPEFPILFLKPLVMRDGSKTLVTCSATAQMDLVRIGQLEEEEERIQYMEKLPVTVYSNGCRMLVFDHSMLG